MFSKIYVIRTEGGGVKIAPSAPRRRGEELIVKINKPWNHYYVSRVKSYFAKTGSMMYIRRR